MRFNKLHYLAWKYPLVKVIFYPFIYIRRSFIKKKHVKQTILIQNIREQLANDPVLKVNEFRGEFVMDRNSDLFARLIIEKKYEPELATYCINYISKNKDVIDVGANIGFYSVLFAKTLISGKVVSIEPTKNALKYLYQNLEINGVREKVDVFEGVASDKIGYMELKTISGKEEYSTLGVMKHTSVIDKIFEFQKVLSTTIDELVIKRSINPGFIKIDVEGAEHLVFKGSLNVLKENRPIVLSELSDYLLRENGSSAGEVIDLIKREGYDVYDPEDPSAKIGWKRSGDIICFPKEMGIKLFSGKI